MSLLVLHQAAAGERMPDPLFAAASSVSIGSRKPATGGGLEGSPLSPSNWCAWCPMPLRKQPSARVSSRCSWVPVGATPHLRDVRFGRIVCNDQRPLRGAVALRTAGWGVARGAWRGVWGGAGGALRHPGHARWSVGRAAAGKERSGPRAPCGAAGRRGSERYWA
jgi:hypothetical protein